MGTSQAAVESRDSAVGVDLVHAVETGSGWSGDKEMALRTEGQMVCRDTGFEGGEDEDLLIAADFKDGAAAVADVETLLAVKCDSGGDTHAFGVSGRCAIGGDAIDRAVVARGNVHLSGAIECDGSRIHHLGNEGLDAVVGVDLESGDGNFLAARAGEGRVDVTFCVECGIGDRVQTLGDGNCDSDSMRITNVTVSRDDDGTGAGAFGDASDQERVGTDYNGAFDLAELHTGTVQFGGPQS